MKNLITVFITITIIICSNLLLAQTDWEIYTTSNSGICSDSILSVYADNNNNIWFGTIRGVSKFDGGNWTNFTSSNSPFTESSGVSAIRQRYSDYYFGGYDIWGLIKYSGGNWSNVPAVNANSIKSMDIDIYNNLWIATYNFGVIKYEGGNITTFNSSDSPLPSDHIEDIKVDMNGNIWAAMTGDNNSSKAGIAEYDGNSWKIFNSNNSALTNENVYAIAEDVNGNMWFGTDSLLLYKYDGINWTRYDLSAQATSNYISSLAVDARGNVWAGLGSFSSERGLIEFDGSNITRYDQNSGFPSDREVNNLEIDKNNNIWIASWDGLIKLNNSPKINVETLSSSDSLRSLTNINLQWNYQFQNNVKIEYSIDNGLGWLLIADNVSSQNDIYNWSVPVVAPLSNECKIRITEVNNPNNKVESNNFTIYAKVETPVVWPNGGIKNNSTLVIVSCPTEGADIYFTTDGSEPTISSKKCDGMIGINQNTTVKVKAFKTDWVDSDVKTNDYTLKVAPVTFSPSPGAYSYAQYVTLSSATLSFDAEDTVIIHYTLDGSEPNEQSLAYNQPIYINKNTIIKAIGYRNNFANSGISSGSYTFSGSNVKAIIKTDSVWLDTDFNGYEERMVDGSESTITNDNFYYLIWTVNGDSAGNGMKVNLKLKTGTNKIVLIASGYKGERGWDTAIVNVYSSRLKTNGGIYSAPAQIDNEHFIVTSNDDKVYQFDSTGTVNWNILTGGAIQSTTCVSDQSNIYVGSTDTRLYSFDQTGTPRWDKAMGGIITSSPSAGKDGVVYVGISTGRLYALDKSGAVIWNVQTGGAIVSSPAVSLDGDIYIGSCDKKLYSVSKDGNVNWTFTTGDSILSSPAIGNDSCVVFGSNDGFIYKLNQSGNKVWSYYAGGKIKSSPIILNHGEIVLGDSNNEILCIGKDGDLAWKYITEGPVSGTAAISKGGQIIIGDEKGILYSLDPLGILLWHFQTSSPIVSPVLITNSNLAIFGNMNGEVYTLKLDPKESLYVGPVDYAWPTFKGNNERTGNKSEVLTGVHNDNSNEVKEYKLSQNYPNPFNPSTIINYQVPASGLVTIKIYDVLGREIETLVNEEKSQGRYKVKLDASDLASGLYFYRITSGNFSETKKMLLLK